MFGIVVFILCCEIAVMVWVWCSLARGFVLLWWLAGVKNGGLKIVKNGPRVWAFCKIEFPGIQKPVQIFGQKWRFFKKCGNRGVGVIWRVRGWFGCCLLCLWFGFAFGCGVIVLGLLCIGLSCVSCFGLLLVVLTWLYRYFR